MNWRGERYPREEPCAPQTGKNPPHSVPHTSDLTCPHATARGPRRRWAQLLARVSEVHPLGCPACHGEMRIVAVLAAPGVVRLIPRDLRTPEHSLPISPARGPPQTVLRAADPPSPRDQGSRGSLETPDHDPFDRSLPGDDETRSA